MAIIYLNAFPEITNKNIFFDTHFMGKNIMIFKRTNSVFMFYQNNKKKISLWIHSLTEIHFITLSLKLRQYICRYKYLKFSFCKLLEVIFSCGSFKSVPLLLNQVYFSEPEETWSSLDIIIRIIYNLGCTEAIICVPFTNKKAALHKAPCLITWRYFVKKVFLTGTCFWSLSLYGS